MAIRRRLLAAMTLGWAILLAGTATAAAADKVTVFAAASLKTAMDAVAISWMETTSKQTAISYAASSALAKQIEEGAPADVFVSADLDWMKYLADKDLVAPGSAVNLLGNEIVLIAPQDSTVEISIEKDFKLGELLGEGRLAMADVKAVPAGKYGKAALQALGVWKDVENKVAQAENVRSALKLVATGEAALGIVYKTDAAAEPAVRIIGSFPDGSHPPIIYPVAVIAQSKNPDAGAFAAFLRSETAQAIFRQQGFTIPVPPASN
jgi:molybdate transport system substrate-binding protein